MLSLHTYSNFNRSSWLQGIMMAGATRDYVILVPDGRGVTFDGQRKLQEYYLVSEVMLPRDEVSPPPIALLPSLKNTGRSFFRNTPFTSSARLIPSPSTYLPYSLPSQVREWWSAAITGEWGKVRRGHASREVGSGVTSLTPGDRSEVKRASGDKSEQSLNWFLGSKIFFKILVIYCVTLKFSILAPEVYILLKRNDLIA